MRSCAARIEKKLNRLDGVTATVNYATEKAAARRSPRGTTAQLLVAAVETGRLHRRPAATARGTAPTAERPPTPSSRSLRTRLITAAVLAVPVIAMAMIPALQFR